MIILSLLRLAFLSFKDGRTRVARFAKESTSSTCNSNKRGAVSPRYRGEKPSEGWE